MPFPIETVGREQREITLQDETETHWDGGPFIPAEAPEMQPICRSRVLLKTLSEDA